MISRTPEETNSFCKYFQDNIKIFNPNAQVWKSKLKSCPKPSKLGYIMYSASTLQVQELVNNMIIFIKKEKGKEIEIAVQS